VNAMVFVLAALACSALLTFYVSHVLGGLRRGLMFGVMLSGLYGALYMLIRSEDYALLLGSALLFAVLGAVMVLTRHVDWYRVEENARDSLAGKSGVENGETAVTGGVSQ